MRRSLVALLLGTLSAAGAAGAPLRVVATTTDLGDLARTIGGDDAEVTVLTKGPQDPHFVEPRPSFVRALHDADLLVMVGMDLEAGWVPVLLRSARNRRIARGAEGFLDASSVVSPLEVPVGPVDRSMGDVHPFGNPHYLTDPVNGWRVAALLRDRMSTLRPQSAARFTERFDGFERRLAEALAGPAAVERMGAAALLEAVERGEPPDGDLGGWLALLAPYAGTRAVQDHGMWPYFARRFGLELVETLEPRPGIAPTTRHLEQVVARIERDRVAVILASPYVDPRHARRVAEQTGARVVEMAHQPGSRDGTPDYLSTVDHNVRRLRGAM